SRRRHTRCLSDWSSDVCSSDLIRKPFQNEQITATVAAGIKRRRKEEERQTLRRAMSRAVDRGEMIGHSDVMQEVFRLVDQVAPEIGRASCRERGWAAVEGEG